jgi:hypothetical protein
MDNNCHNGKKVETFENGAWNKICGPILDDHTGK